MAVVKAGNTIKDLVRELRFADWWLCNTSEVIT